MSQQTRIPAERHTGNGLAYPSLHGLRGLLALWVMLSHVLPGTLPGALAFIGVQRYGSLAVKMFFVMSGFILAHAHAHAIASPDRGRIIDFWKLRLWRTVPAHVASVLVALIISVAVIGTIPTPGQVARSLALFTTWAAPVPGNRMNGPVWSLQAECVGYLVLPALFIVMQAPSVRRWLGWLTIGVAVGQVAISRLLGLGATAFGELGALVWMGGGCTLGCLLWMLRDHPGLHWLRGDWAFAGLAVIITASLCRFDAVYSVPLLAPLVYSLAYCGPIMGGLLNSRAMTALGRLSFSLYITHYPVWCAFVRMAQQGTLTFVWARILALVCCILVSLYVCLLVEEPARRFGRNFRLADLSPSGLACALGLRSNRTRRA